MQSKRAPSSSLVLLNLLQGFFLYFSGLPNGAQLRFAKATCLLLLRWKPSVAIGCCKNAEILHLLEVIRTCLESLKDEGSEISLLLSLSSIYLRQTHSKTRRSCNQCDESYNYPFFISQNLISLASTF